MIAVAQRKDEKDIIMPTIKFWKRFRVGKCDTAEIGYIPIRPFPSRPVFNFAPMSTLSAISPWVGSRCTVQKQTAFWTFNHNQALENIKLKSDDFGSGIPQQPGFDLHAAWKVPENLRLRHFDPNWKLHYY